MSEWLLDREWHLWHLVAGTRAYRCVTQDDYDLTGEELVMGYGPVRLPTWTIRAACEPS